MKTNRQTLVFQLDAFTPDTMPVQKFGRYVIELAKWFSKSDTLRFRSISKSSFNAHLDYDITQHEQILHELESPPTKILEMLGEDGCNAAIYGKDLNCALRRLEPLHRGTLQYREQISVRGLLTEISYKRRDRVFAGYCHVDSPPIGTVRLTFESAASGKLARSLVGDTVRIEGTASFFGLSVLESNVNEISVEQISIEKALSINEAIDTARHIFAETRLANQDEPSTVLLGYR